MNDDKPNIAVCGDCDRSFPTEKAVGTKHSCPVCGGPLVVEEG